MSSEDGVLVARDARGRVNLMRLAGSHYYLAKVEPGGVIVLTPAVVVPAKVLEMPEGLSKRIDEFLDDPSKGVRMQRPQRNKE